MDKRLESLKQWLAELLDAPEYEIKPASADASFRRYFRVFVGGISYIAMDAPPDKEDSRPFVRIAQHFFSLGLNVPEIIHQDLDQGFLLISDLGNKDYLDHLNNNSVECLYGDAMGALIVLQTGTFSDRNFLPNYDKALLLSEMRLFEQWYLERHLGKMLTDGQRDVLQHIFDHLSELALKQSKVWVHRDYHSRNLIKTEKNNPGILDFQDAVLGPVTYDLVSLLEDCYIAWPRHLVESWVKGYHHQCLESGIPVCDDDKEFLQWFDKMGVQRHLKAIGIFCRLNYRDNKPTYINDIPRTLSYIQAACLRYRDLKPMARLLEDLEIN